jgi:hypothetical protein
MSLTWSLFLFQSFSLYLLLSSSLSLSFYVSNTVALYTHYISSGQGKSTYTFSAQRRRISAFRLLALTTEAWQGAEIRRRSAENVYIDLPEPN